MDGVIYLFVSPSGRAYAGWHGCDPSAVPRRGTGPLPTKRRYTGSGTLWENVARKHGPDLRWVILRRLTGAARADVDAAERRAIRLVRAVWGEMCANIANGGDGLTSDVVRALWSDPEYASKVRAAVARATQAPEARAQQSLRSKVAMNRPEARARNRANGKARAATPEGAEQIRLAREAGCSEQARAKRSEINGALSRNPEWQAKRTRTLRINNSWRRLAEQHPEWWVPPSSDP